MTDILKLAIHKLPLEQGQQLWGNFGYIAGKEKYIIVSDECIHWILDYDKPMLFTGTKDGNTPGHSHLCKIPVSHDLLTTVISEPVDIVNWVQCFGFKDRIKFNYSLLQDNCNKLGIYIKFPEWRMR